MSQKEKASGQTTFFGAKSGSVELPPPKAIEAEELPKKIMLAL
jgi:hypothetical protein